MSSLLIDLPEKLHQRDKKQPEDHHSPTEHLEAMTQMTQRGQEKSLSHICIPINQEI